MPARTAGRKRKAPADLPAAAAGRAAKSARVKAQPPRGAKTGRMVVDSDEEDEEEDEDEGDGYEEGDEDDDDDGEESDFADKATEAEDEEDDDDEDEDNDDRRPDSWEVKLPRAREAGSTPYEAATLHPNTALFLRDLKANNRREWLKMHDEDYRNAQKDFEAFVDEVSDKITELDATVPELPKKDIIFRIYRDVRFSNDPTPYKPHFSVAWSRTGRKGPYAAYYLHIEPGGNSFVGGGLWQPEAHSLLLLREAIDTTPQDLKNALMTPVLRDTFFPAAKGGEKGVVKAFIAKSSKGALKTKPKNFDANHAEIDLLRLRSFTMGKPLPDRDVFAADVLDKVTAAMRGLVPWVTYLNSVVRPDRE